MTMRMIQPVVDRVIQVLRDFLPAELDLIDAEEGQAATPDVANGNYWSYLRPVVIDFPAVRIEVKGTTINEVDNLTGLLSARRIDAYHRIEVWIDAQAVTAEDDAGTLQRWMMTYSKAVFRVLCVAKPGLETALDPVLWATSVEPDGEIRIHAATDQEGAIVRSAVVPIRVRRIENRG